MRLTIVISSLAGGGAERAVSEMANCWARSKCDVTIITWDHHGDQDAYRLDPSVERVRLGLRRHSTGWWQRLSGALGRIASLRAALRRSAPDVVLSFTDSMNVLSISPPHGGCAFYPDRREIAWICNPTRRSTPSRACSGG
ncbi:MAG: glycosyltransferase [Steroidobacteraceae bacterium]